VRKLLVLIVLAAVAVASAAFATSAPSASAKRVKVGDNWFVRASGVPTVTVSKGTKVRWVWTGDNPHNVKVKRGPDKFKSPSKTGGRWSKVVRERGTYTIVCTVHGGKDQKMKLVVQ
jgi:plastocyanin